MRRDGDPPSKPGSRAAKGRSYKTLDPYLEYYPTRTYAPETVPRRKTTSRKGPGMQTLVFLLLVAFAAGAFCGCLVQRALVAYWYRRGS